MYLQNIITGNEMIFEFKIRCLIGNIFEENENGILISTDIWCGFNIQRSNAFTFS